MVWELLNIEKSYQIKFKEKQSKLRVHSWKAFDVWDFLRWLPKFLAYGVENIEFWEIFVIEKNIKTSFERRN